MFNVNRQWSSNVNKSYGLTGKKKGAWWAIQYKPVCEDTAYAPGDIPSMTESGTNKKEPAGSKPAGSVISPIVLFLQRRRPDDSERNQSQEQ